MKIVLLGPQGSGKGTQAQHLAELTGARHIASGNLVRSEIDRGTELGRRVKEYNDRGDLVPDEMVVSLVKPLLMSSESWILDGFPRDETQAGILDGILGEMGARLDAVIALEAPDAALIERLSGRRTSESTGKTYHIVNNPPPSDDPGPFVQRRDDEPEEIRRRLEIYHRETEPLKAYYARRGRLSKIDACQEIDEVTAEIVRVLQQRGVKV